MKTIDQATHLRRLVLGAARENTTAGAPPPRLIVVGGAKHGAGATTVAVNLAVAMAEQGTRCVLVDADLYQAEIADRCGLTVQSDVTDVLAARRDIHEVLHPGPAGVQIVPGLRSAVRPGEFSESAQQRLLRQLRGLGRHAEVLVVDTGSGAHEVARRFWAAADQIVLVAVPDAQSLLDAYADIKRTAACRSELAICLVVNRVANRQAGEEVYRRLDGSCRRFLGFSVDYLGHVPDDDRVSDAAALGKPCVLRTPGSIAAIALESLAARLADRTGSSAVAGQAGGRKAENFVASSPVADDFGR
jgi:flagellar biosynthesis protein FlhG